MIAKLEEINRRFLEVSDFIIQPDIIADNKRFAKLNKEYKDLGKIVDAYQKYKDILSNIEGTKKVLKDESDEEFRDMAKMELDELVPKKEEIEAILTELLIPKDPDDDKNCILEIRAGAGGDESAIFAGDLLRMYQRYCDKNNFKFVVSEFVEGTMGGYSRVIAFIEGEDIYGKLKFESGVHRVQRVPQTESQGRVHTSAASIAILPEVDEVEFELDMKDIRKDTFRASGAGGQHVNKTESAIRLTHIPTGVVVECQDGRSQHANFATALKELRSRLYAAEVKKQDDEISSNRRSLIGSGDRSDKIRTYNYPQGRVTDHRINKTVYNLTAIMDGDINEFIEGLRIAHYTEKMKSDHES